MGTPLSRGSLWHLVLECHYTWVQRFGKNVAVNPAFLFNWAKENLLYDEAGRQNEDQEKVEWLYDGHLDCYGVDPDWEVLEVETAKYALLPVPEGSPRVWLRFKVDLVVRDRTTGRVWLVDHKSARDFSRQVEVDLDDQFGLYTWALRQLGYPVFGTVRSDARTQRNKSPMTLEQRFRRVETFRTDLELENLARDAAATAQAAWGDTPLHSSPAPDRCSWRCDFLQAHLLYRKGVADEETVLRDFGFQVNERKHREYEEDPVVSRVPPAGTPKPHLWVPPRSW